jgi:methylated-DNA-protein-cysteine methyltransferase related protein
MRISTNNTNNPINFFKQVREIVKKIPRGKVMTYGQIAAALGTKYARAVGWALHGNRDRDCPCHRVVNKDGGVAVNYGLGGGQEQKRRLVEEGVRFIDATHVDLVKFRYGLAG